MSDDQENPPAFPTHNGLDRNNEPHGGMTLHDYFAAHANVPWEAAVRESQNVYGTPNYAKAYKIWAEMKANAASAMLKARQP